MLKRVSSIFCLFPTLSHSFQSSTYLLYNLSFISFCFHTFRVEKFVQSVVTTFVSQVDLSDRAPAQISALYTRATVAETGAALAAKAAASGCASKCDKRKLCRGNIYKKLGFFGVTFITGLLGGLAGAAIFGAAACRHKNSGNSQ